MGHPPAKQKRAKGGGRKVSEDTRRIRSLMADKVPRSLAEISHTLHIAPPKVHAIRSSFKLLPGGLFVQE